MSDPKLITFAEFSRHAGVSKAAITQAIKRGKLVAVSTPTGERFLDMSSVSVVNYLNHKTDPERRRSIGAKAEKLAKNPAKTPRPSKKIPSKPAPQSPPSADVPKPPTTSEAIIDPKLDNVLDHDYQKTLQVIAQRKKTELETAIKAGDYISRDEIIRFIMKYYRVHSGTLKPFGKRMSADLAAALGITDPAMIKSTEARIDSEIFGVLKQLKTISISWLRSNGTRVHLDD